MFPCLLFSGGQSYVFHIKLLLLISVDNENMIGAVKECTWATEKKFFITPVRNCSVAEFSRKGVGNMVDE